MNNIYQLLLILLLAGCTSNANLDQTLVLAGENRSELEKVLHHYPKGSLKHDAAKFLIGNMAHHYAKVKVGEIPESVKENFHTLDTSIKKHIIPQTRKKYLKWSLIDPTTALLDSVEITQEKGSFYDIEEIKADWLIAHIDDAFLTWESSPLRESIDFDTFKETLLSYRFLKEHLNFSTDFIQDRYKSFLLGDSSYNPENVVDQFNLYSGNMEFITKNTLDQERFLGFYNILQVKHTECDDHAAWAAHVLNKCGIPSYIDVTTGWLDRGGPNHYWCTIQGENQQALPFTPGWQALYQKAFFKRACKVFRRYYSYQEESALTLRDSEEKIPGIFADPYIRDVTDEYHDVIDLDINLPEIPKSTNLAYLGIFTPKGWVPVGYGTISHWRNKVTFKQTPINVVYVAGYFNGKTVSPVGAPFYINKEGEKIDIVPDYDNKIDLKAIRKYPIKERLARWTTHLDSGVFQGANKADFSDAVELYRLNKQPDPMIYEGNTLSKLAVRYVRFVTAKNEDSHMAIMEYLGKPEKGDSVDHGSKPYILDEKDSILWDDYDAYTVLKGAFINKPVTPLLTGGFDGNMETFTNYKQPGLDFGKPRIVDKIRFARRNGNNMIESGSRYKLLYFDMGWKEAGVIKAKYNFVEFKNVPSNTVYWLRNLDHGKEELSFMYFNGQQYFVNSDDISELPVFKNF